MIFHSVSLCVDEPVESGMQSESCLFLFHISNVQARPRMHERLFWQHERLFRQPRNTLYRPRIMYFSAIAYSIVETCVTDKTPREKEHTALTTTYCVIRQLGFCRSNEDVITRLHIERAKKTDSGEYTCSVSQFSTTAVHIHVLNGKLNKKSPNGISVDKWRYILRRSGMRIVRKIRDSRRPSPLSRFRRSYNWRFDFARVCVRVCKCVHL